MTSCPGNPGIPLWSSPASLKGIKFQLGSMCVWPSGDGVPGADTFVSVSLPSLQPPNPNRTTSQTPPDPTSPGSQATEERINSSDGGPDPGPLYWKPFSFLISSGEMDQQSEIPTEIIFQFLIIGHKSRPREIDSIRNSLCRTLHLPLWPLYFSNF